jgi:uncharacterized protein YdeI (YjbR/CyaY-like superfamily)
MIRFTPRSPTSTWSNVNVGRMAELMAEGLAEPAGRRAFARRTADRSGAYSFEQADAAALSDAHQARFRADERAWAFFSSQPPGYRRAAVWWVVSAKREETQARRLESLISDSADGRRVGPLRRPDRNNRP